MHSSQELTTEMFEIEAQGKAIHSISQVIPEFNLQDRLGIILYESFDAIKCSAFISAMITAFYDEKRKSCHDFFIYPDYFIFFAGCPVVDYGMLDIWPSHKMVSVQNEPEEILRAVNDRAITILITTKSLRRESKLELQTRNSALARFKQVFLLKKADAVKEANIKIRGNLLVNKYTQEILHAHETLLTEKDRIDLCDRHADAIEWYQRISPHEVLEYL